MFFYVFLFVCRGATNSVEVVGPLKTVPFRQKNETVSDTLSDLLQRKAKPQMPRLTCMVRCGWK